MFGFGNSNNSTATTSAQSATNITAGSSITTFHSFGFAGVESGAASTNTAISEVGNAPSTAPLASVFGFGDNKSVICGGMSDDVEKSTNATTSAETFSSHGPKSNVLASVFGFGLPHTTATPEPPIQF
uniref:Uncharacterized protein n=1 Tax=Lygus hesperus TaxID=30085 RepID=A0A0A9WKY1_LYGHE